MERAVITGATGFIGSNMTRLLLEKGFRVYALVRPQSQHIDSLPIHENLEIVRCGLEDVLTCVPHIEKADVFFHFAWGGVNRSEIDSPEVQAENISGSLDCIKAAHLLQCKVFADAGSRVEYGITTERMSEGIECSPVNEYGKAKLEFYKKAKPLCEEMGMKFYHLRFFSVYGYGDHPWSIISTLIRELRKNEKVSLSDCRHLWNFMYIDDAVSAVYELYRHADKHKETTCIVNIAGEDIRPLKEFVEEVKEITGGSGSLEYGTFVQAKEGALSIQPVIETLKTLTDGEWTEVFTFRSGILETIKKEVERENEKNQCTDSLL